MKIPAFTLFPFIVGATLAATVDSSLPPYQAHAVSLSKEATYVSRDGAVRITGAEHAGMMIAGFNELFQRTHPGFKFAVALKGTTTGMPALTHGVTLFAPMGREINGVELVPYAKIVGQDPVEIHVAHDSNTPGKLATSLAVYVNRSNPLDQLTMDQVARIFGTGLPNGDLTAWSQLGMKGEWSKLAIHPYATPEHSGFGDYMQKHVLSGHRLSAACEQFGNTEEIIKRVAGDAAAIGFAAIGVTNPDVKRVALSAKADGTYSLGSAEDIVAGKYPLGRFLYFYVRRVPGQPVDPVVKEYFRLILSQEGQAIIAGEENGYIPLTATEAATELAKLD